jgi:uncharacterized protein YqgC (DUF456 family)
MFGRIMGALAGRSIARNVGTVAGGTRGALIGAALPTVMRRMGPMGMIAAAAGGYAVKRLIDKRRAQQATTGAAPRYSGPKVRP